MSTRYRFFLLDSRPVILFTALAIGVLMPNAQSAKAFDYEVRPNAPEFTHQRVEDWVNSAPLSISELAGRVVLLDIWTFDCWNCYRSFPWLTALEHRLSDQPFTVVGVHTPEFKHEHSLERVVEKTKEFDLRHPVMLDNDYSYWKALSNRYWPTYYLIDKQGRIAKRFIGETRAESERAQAIEVAIRELLAE